MPQLPRAASLGFQRSGSTSSHPTTSCSARNRTNAHCDWNGARNQACRITKSALEFSIHAGSRSVCWEALTLLPSCVVSVTAPRWSAVSKTEDNVTLSFCSSAPTS
eukprot:scaffold631_cov378-Prasinococcus_capsulatus_cf.AAC.18